MTNSVDPDQTAPRLFAKAFLSLKNYDHYSSTEWDHFFLIIFSQSR